MNGWDIKVRSTRVGIFLIGIRFWGGAGSREKENSLDLMDQDSLLNISTKFKKTDWQRLGRAEA